LTWDIPGSEHGPKWLTHGWAVNSLMTFHGGQPIDEFRTGYNEIANPFAGVWHSFKKKRRDLDQSGLVLLANR
jgi:hypothetical protein